MGASFVPALSKRELSDREVQEYEYEEVEKEKLREKAFDLAKVGTLANPADLGTKAMALEALLRPLPLAGVGPSADPELAPHATVAGKRSRPKAKAGAQQVKKVIAICFSTLLPRSLALRPPCPFVPLWKSTNGR